MKSSRDLPPLEPVAAGMAGLLDQIEGVQCWIKDREGRYRWVNRGFLLNYALERVEQVVGRTDHDLSPAHLADQYRLDDDRVLGGEPVDGRIELVGRFDRTAVWSLTTKQPLRDARGTIIGTLGMTRMVDAAAVHAGGEDAALGRVLVHMRNNFAEPLSNAALARLAGAIRAGLRADVSPADAGDAAAFPAPAAAAAGLPGIDGEQPAARRDRGGPRLLRPEPLRPRIPPRVRTHAR